MKNVVHDSDAPTCDVLLTTLADYASDQTRRFSSQARAIAALCLMDALACAAGALDDIDCRRLIGPVVPGAILRGGPRVPFTALELDPIRAAFSTGIVHPLARLQRHDIQRRSSVGRHRGNTRMRRLPRPQRR